METLKVGLEIHQQLDTKKLFCNCPGILRQEQPDYEIERKLHVVAGESGAVDDAASYEAGKNKTFIYQGYKDSCCLVELDEAPPFEINKEALKIAIQISLLLNCEILQNTQIMRKTVINGSNTSGFQRTMMIAKNGYVETSEGKVAIQGIFLEEDSAREIKSDKEKTIYRLDRLGIPLVEIATAPDIKSGRQARQVALHIGEILRACKVKRGLGTIRQDVNVSLNVDGKQGSRVEIKGVQDPDLIEKTLLIETERQSKLIKQNKSVSEVRKALLDGKTSFLRPMPGQDRMYPETDLPLLHTSRDFINETKKTLPKLKSEMKEELNGKGLNQELINLILQENKLEEFKELLNVYNNAELIVKMLILWPKEIANKNKLQNIGERVNADALESILHSLSEKKISESDVRDILEQVAKGKPLKDALKKEKVGNAEEEILSIIKERPGLSSNAYMGLVMQKFKGKISGKEAMEIIERLLK